MNDFLPAQPGDEDDDDSDDEVQIGVQRQDFVDPITLRPIEDAVVVYVPLSLYNLSYACRGEACGWQGTFLTLSDRNADITIREPVSWA